MRFPGSSLARTWDPLTLATLLLVVASVALGGASREHALRLALVELSALPLLVMAAERLIRGSAWKEHRFALGLVAAIVAIPIVQLTPLPPAVWTALPGRDQMVLALQLAGLEPGWAPLTVAPDLTYRSALALIPPVALFLSVLALPAKQREGIVYTCIAAALLSIVLGASQFIVGGGRLHLWNTSNPEAVTGFFANRNHLASYLLVTLSFAVVLAASAMRRRGGQTARLWFGALFVGLVVVSLAIIRSRAGITLFAPAIMASLLAAWIAAGRGRPRPGLLILIGSTGAALTAVAILALPTILVRFDSPESPGDRLERWPKVAEAAQSYLPVGSGLGSFNAVYRSVEPLEELDDTYFNQAHNDYLETWLEAGWLGAGLIVAFFVWFGRRSWSAWAARASTERDLQRAASIGIGVLLLHSAVDYPLRTTTLAVLFALCCGLLELATRADSARRS